MAEDRSGLRASLGQAELALERDAIIGGEAQPFHAVRRWQA
jgi:hypothetical protein